MIKQVAFIVGFLTAPAFGVIIDDFSVGPMTLVADIDHRMPYELQTGLDPDAVIGGNRLAFLLLDSPSPSDRAVATVDTTTHTFRLDVDGRLEGYSIRWGAINGTQADLALNADLLSDGSDAFHVDVVANAVSQTLKLSVASGAHEGQYSGDGVFRRLPASNTPFSIRVPFSDLSKIDFHDVDYIGLSWTTVFRGQDLTLGAIRTVPEPSTLVMLILGLLGVWMRRR